MLEPDEADVRATRVVEKLIDKVYIKVIDLESKGGAAGWVGEGEDKGSARYLGS